MVPEATFQGLIQKAQAGDRLAFDKLVDRCAPRIEALVRRELGSKLSGKVEVEDLIQETFTNAWQSIEAFRWQGEEAFWAWLITIARHAIDNEAHWFSARKRAADREVSLEQKSLHHGEKSREMGDLLEANTPTPSKQLRRDLRFERLKEALQKLKTDHRKVILLMRIRGLSVKEAAREMGRSEGAISMLLFRALKQLKEIFGNTDSLHLSDRSLEEESHGSE